MKVSTRVMSFVAMLATLVTGVTVRAGDFDYLDDELIYELDENGLDRPLVIQKSLNLALSGSDRLNIRQILGVDGRYNGLRVKAVTVQAISRSSYSTAELLINGYSTGDIRQVTGGRLIFRIDPTDNILGRDISALQLYTRGALRLTRLGVILEGASQHPMRLGRSLQRTYMGYSEINLEALLGLQRFNGTQVRSVTLIASSRSRAVAEICSYAYCLEQRAIGPSLRSIRFTPNGRIGIELDRMHLQLRGTVYVESVIVELANTGLVRSVVTRPVVRPRPVIIPGRPGGKPIPRGPIGKPIHPRPHAHVSGGVVVRFP